MDELITSYNSLQESTKQPAKKSLLERMAGWAGFGNQYYYPDKSLPKIAYADIQKFGDYFGFDIQKTPEGKIVALPKNLVNTGDFTTFMDLWRAIEYSASPATENRNIRFRSYDRMDSSGSEVALTLDTYTDEILGVTAQGIPQVKFTVNDMSLQRKLEKVLELNDVLKNAHEDIRTICKYGDYAYAIEVPYQDELDSYDIMKGNSTISRPFRVEDITVRFIHPRNYELQGFNGQLFKLVGNPGAVNGIEKDYLPWEFIVSSIKNRDTFPYGYPPIEKMRIKFEQLLVMEQLLAICRDSKREKIVVKVEGGGNDPTSNANKISQTKAAFNNIMFGGVGGRQTRPADHAMTQYLWTTDKVSFEVLKNNLDVSSTEDVEYFREQVIACSRLPKGLFLADNSDNAYGGALKYQDLKFGRSTVQPKISYEQGLERLIRLIAFYLGADLSKLEVKVYIPVTESVTGEKLDNFDKAVGVLNNYVQMRQSMDPDFSLDDSKVYQICRHLNIDPNIFGLKDRIIGKQLKTSNPTGQSTRDIVNNTDFNDNDNAEEAEVAQESSFSEAQVIFENGSKMSAALYDLLKVAC